ncbi:MAG: hypothetical protein ABJD68_07785 [Nakamurella sp.]
MTKFQVWAGNLQGQQFDEKSSYTINPTTGVLTLHWPDGRLTHYSPNTWERVEDDPVSSPAAATPTAGP